MVIVLPLLLGSILGASSIGASRAHACLLWRDMPPCVDPTVEFSEKQTEKKILGSR
jgi:hypothetical protein